MTHTGPLPDDAGTFNTEQPATTPCRTPECPGPVVMRVWESNDGAYEDYHYRCTTCKKSWWVDGIDS